LDRLKAEQDILGVFAKLRKANVSFVISVYLPVNLHGTTLLKTGGF
jgi:hypothetical protein